MTTGYRRAADFLSGLLAESDLDELAERLRPDPGSPSPHVPGAALVTPEAVERRWEILPHPVEREDLLDARTRAQMALYGHNIENFIGTVKLPVGLAGPLRVRGLFAQGDFYVPLATTEAALVASYSRGAMLISEVGGASTVLLNEGVSRSPAFAFASLEELGRFVAWLLGQQEAIRQAAEATTRFGKLVDLQISIEGNHVYLVLVYTTGDAAGQNMATIATEAAVAWIREHTPVQPRAAYIEANFSGDKKASVQSLQSVRGRKVTAEVRIPAELVRRRLHTSVEAMVDYGRFATVGGVMSGTLGIEGHYANGLAAMFIACGQDAACVAEAAVGNTRMEMTGEGALYVSVTLPNLIVGSVGGGTRLPSQQACLGLMGLAGSGHGRALAEVAAALCLAGEISIVGAICAGEFTRAHARLARGARG
ncbi:MAG: hydroxymethylglutaryl-CoA reductase [Gammaproteobacteria bacterium]|nr:hydroxymethylglutaryl-CoA reductase [Gammaproteobacteria bacterium]